MFQTSLGSGGTSDGHPDHVLPLSGYTGTLSPSPYMLGRPWLHDTECSWKWCVPLQTWPMRQSSPHTPLCPLWGRRKDDGPEKTGKHMWKTAGHPSPGFLDDHTEEVSECEINFYWAWAMMQLLVYCLPPRLNEITFARLLAKTMYSLQTSRHCTLSSLRDQKGGCIEEAKHRGFKGPPFQWEAHLQSWTWGTAWPSWGAPGKE